MRANGVVVPPPFLDHNPRLSSTPEPFYRQALVSQFAIKTLVQTVLPWLAWLNQRQIQYSVIFMNALEIQNLQGILTMQPQ
jgi:hypothetical protein